MKAIQLIEKLIRKHGEEAAVDFLVFELGREKVIEVLCEAVDNEGRNEDFAESLNLNYPQVAQAK